MTKIQHKRSNVLEGGSAKEPSAGQMEYGELAVNYNDADPSLFIKDSNDQIVKIAGEGSVGTPDVGDGTITVRQPGTTDQTFTVNQSGNTTIDLKNDNTVVIPGDGMITIRQPGTTDQSFTVNQTGNTTIDLKNDNTVVTPGNGSLNIRNYGDTTNSSGTFTANQSSNSTVTLPQVKYANIADKPTIPSVGNGTITITQPGTTNQTFSVNQSGNTTIALKNDNTVPSVGNGKITVRQPGTIDQTFTVNQSGDTTIDLKNDNTVPTVGNGTITITQPGTTNQTFSVNQTGNTTIALKNDNTVTTPGNGALTIRNHGDTTNSTGTFTANQSSGSIVTLPQIKYANIAGRPAIPSVGNGTITIVQPGTDNQTFSVNQSGNTTINLKNDNTVPSVGNGALTIRNHGDTTNSTGTFTANQSSGSIVTLPQIKYANISGKPTIPTNNNQLTNGAGYITSADGGNAQKLDGFDSSQFLRSDVADQKTSGTLRFNDNIYLTLGTGDDARFFCNGSHFYLDLNSDIGNFYIRDGTTTRFTFDDAGHFTATGNVTAYSDINLKKNVEVIPDALNKVLQLRGVTYDRTDIECNRQSGVIAQEVEAVIPEVVQTDENGIKSVAYGNLVGLLIESIKELKAEVEELKKDIN